MKTTQDRFVSTRAELLAALQDPDAGAISVSTDLTELPTLRLLPGQALTGANDAVTLRFAAGQDGVQLTTK